MASVDTYFSVLSLFILFRETIEASIICSILLQFLNRSKPGLKKAVWYGVAAGVGVSIVFGVIFIAIYYTARDNLFSGKKRAMFKGVISWIAAFLITILGFAMLRFLGWEAKWKRKLEAAMAAKVPDVVAEPTDGAAAATNDTNCVTSSAAGAVQLPVRKSSSPVLSASPTLATTSSSSASATTSDVKQVAKEPGNAVISADDVEAAVPGVVAVSKLSSSGVSTPNAPGGDEVAAAPLDNVDRSPPTRKEILNIFVLVFTTVVREGIESVVFLGGLANVKVTAIPLPAFVGIACGCLVGIFLYYSGRQVKDIKWLVIIMAIIIFFIAAGQVNLGTDALMNADAFGYCSPWLDERPWYMVPIYNWSKCCSDIDPKGTEPVDQQNRQRFFALVRAIFGYQDKGTPLEIISYCCYWGLVLILMAWKAWRGTLLDADYKYKRQQRKLAKEEAARAAAEAESADALEGGAAAGTGAVHAGAGGEVTAARRWLRSCSQCTWTPACFRRDQR
ncbi:hypothetical protein VOLCADRAFT_77510 [Volvox carteri f. nagariensis]|uniref:Iron permease FTR1 n=1 Tax=Volvox carteri f. nagariensis TaxID=3068 RepID=D8UEV4_VOLCA|nr:uncharacterized protein VOLCADRAFT_77510 [Volvox carteri f. nagariensis]EFJ41749.1 hypothetical protein VOLCADRAFT_77510 [Volvox carteri f. nagariensis]|eukprot:XP_002957251.1 hypothetical protein VOLCADRAFT_77510 [Volvox carteri f. nagariensis]